MSRDKLEIVYVKDIREVLEVALLDGAPGGGGRPITDPVISLIQQGESGTLEFKSTFQWDVKQSKQVTGLRDSVLKTVAAYLNSEGGTLLIGVEDNGDIFGLEKDLGLVKGKSLDQFELLLMRVITDRIGTEFSPYVRVSFETVTGKTVCIVEVKPAPKENFVDGQKFYIRTGNATRELPTPKALEYIRMHWNEK